MKARNIKYYLLLTLLLICLAPGMITAQIVRVGLAWQPNPKANDRVVRSIELAGGEAVLLQQVRPVGWDYDSLLLNNNYVDSNGVLLSEYAERVKLSSWHDTNAAQVLEGVDAVVFLGGGDISSTLFRVPESWGGETCDAARDVSEYLTMAYCLDHDIPVMGLCRGMQMLSVVSGASMIQDLGTYYSAKGVDYDNLHRSLRDENGNRHYTPHDVLVTDHNSRLYAIAKSDTIKNVPSLHHQVVSSIDGTQLKVTGVTHTQGVDIIEAVERKDKGFALGVQFHPEEAVRKNLYEDPDADQFMQLYEGVNYFRELINYCINQHKN